MKDIANALRLAAVIQSEDLDQALDVFGETDELWRALVNKGLLTEEEVFKALAAFNNLEYVDLTGVQIDSQVISAIPASYCRRAQVLPIGIRNDHIFLAISDPANIVAIDDVATMTTYMVAPKVVSPTILQAAIDRYLRSDEELVALSEELGEAAVAEQEVKDITAEDDAPIVRFVNLLINQAIQDRASDIHVEPGAKELKVRFRIDGVLHEMQRADRSIQAGILSRLKIMADIDIAEKRKPQDGRMSVTSRDGKPIDIRVASLPTVWGEKIIMRILDHDTEKRNLDSIGMSDENLAKFRAAISKPHGMVLVTGPTGSGKSTSLYTSLDEVANVKVNVITVEDPVEKRIEGVNQVQINNKAGLTFPSALKSILRSDPDIVLIGEIRDRETATIAVEASLTGHLVLSTLHTNGAPDALPRLIEMGVEPYLVSTAVSCVAAQRLARRLCEKCKAILEPDEDLLERVNFPRNEDGTYPPITKAVGCDSCAQTGYRGRLAVLEVMPVTEEIERMVVERAPSSVLRAKAAEQGLKSLREDGWRLVKLGLTTVEEVLRVCA